MGFILKLSTFLLQTISLELLSTTVFVACDGIISSPRVTNWGSWGDWDFCPPSTYVVGFQLKVEASVGSGSEQDDTSLNGIKLLCTKSPSSDSRYDYQIASAQGPWGDWQRKIRCVTGFVTGFKIRQEAPCGECDDTASNNFGVFCGGEGWKLGRGTSWGSWSKDINCQGAEKVCGIRTQVEAPLGKGDDTALNNVELKCCR